MKQTYINVSLSTFTVIDRVFGELLRDTLLLFVERFARLFGPPLLKFAILVVQATGRVESVLRMQTFTIPSLLKTEDDSQLTHGKQPYRMRHSSCMLA